MDILEQYNREKPHVSVSVVPSGYCGMISLVLRHSGGALKTERQAAYALLALVCVIGLVSIFLFIKGIGWPYTERGPGLTPKELEEYKKIQPF